MATIIQIVDREVGVGKPVFIIAEAGVNHNGDIAIAKKLVDAAKAAGADAIKFQTFTADSLVTNDAKQATYQAKNIGKEESQYAMLKRLELPTAAFKELAHYAKKQNIIFLSTPFSEEDADILEDIVPAYKIPSGEINNLPYLEYIAKKKKPMIVSSGMANMQEVKEAIHIIRHADNNQIIVLHSTSNYPPSDISLNLKVITTMRKELDVPIGYSDNGHGTLDGNGSLAPIVATAIGACVLEKHFTLDKKLPGPDHKASLNPEELQAMVQAVRRTSVILGSSKKECTEEEKPIRDVIRKSLVATRDICVGENITRDMITTKRPGTGLPPTMLVTIVDKKAKLAVSAGQMLPKGVV